MPPFGKKHAGHKPGYESTGGPSMPERKTFDSTGGPTMKEHSGPDVAPNNPSYGKQTASRYPKGKQVQQSSFKTDSSNGAKGIM